MSNHKKISKKLTNSEIKNYCKKVKFFHEKMNNLISASFITPYLLSDVEDALGKVNDTIKLK